MVKIIHRLPAWFRARENILALCIAGIVLISHLVIVDRVSSLIYDEKYYVAEGQVIRYVNGARSEEQEQLFWTMWENTIMRSVDAYVSVAYIGHMPFSKLCIAGGIQLFGYGPLGWRITPILFGTASIILFYLLCQQLTSRRWLPLVATFLFAFDNMNFVMSSLAMLDAFYVTFMLAAFLFYIRRNYVTCGILMALCVLAKETGALAGVIILGHWLISRRDEKLNIAKFGSVAMVTFFTLLPLLDYLAVRIWITPWERLDNMATYLIDDVAAFSSSISRQITQVTSPWEWIFSPEMTTVWSDPDYHINLNWNIWALIIPVTGYMIYRSIGRGADPACRFALLWFSAIYLSWLVLYAAGREVMYSYYLYPTVGALCLATGYILTSLATTEFSVAGIRLDRGMKAMAAGWMIAHLVVFWMMSPVLY